MRRALFFAAAIAAFVALGRAHADEASRRAAEALFAEARTLMVDGRYAEACPKLERSYELDAALGTLLNLAVCFEKNGQTARAWETYKRAIARAAEKRDAKREKFARERVAAIEPDLARVTIVVGEPKPARVTQDDQEVPVLSWGVAVPIDPGQHTFRASAPGFRPWSTTLAIEARQSTTIRVPPLEPEPAPPPSASATAPPSPPASASAAPPAASSAPPRPPPPPPPRAPEASLPSQRVVALVIGGVGSAALVGGALVGLIAKVHYDSADSLCHGNACSSDGAATRDDAFNLAQVATWAFITGGALTVVGLTLWLTAPKREGAAVRALVTPSGARLRVEF